MSKKLIIWIIVILLALAILIWAFYPSAETTDNSGSGSQTQIDTEANTLIDQTIVADDEVSLGDVV